MFINCLLSKFLTTLWEKKKNGSSNQNQYINVRYFEEQTWRILEKKKKSKFVKRKKMVSHLKQLCQLYENLQSC